MNANAMKLESIAREARLVHTLETPYQGAQPGSLDLVAISEALGVSRSVLISWLRNAELDKSARSCPSWAPRLLRYLVDDPESDVGHGRRRGKAEYAPLGSGLSEPSPNLWKAIPITPYVVDDLSLARHRSRKAKRRLLRLAYQPICRNAKRKNRA